MLTDGLIAGWELLNENPAAYERPPRGGARLVTDYWLDEKGEKKYVVKDSGSISSLLSIERLHSASIFHGKEPDRKANVKDFGVELTSWLSSVGCMLSHIHLGEGDGQGL